MAALQDGWGVTNGGGEGKHLVISDGSSKLFFVDPTTLETKKVLQVSNWLERAAKTERKPR